MKLGGHQPLHLAVKCTGNGTRVLLIEAEVGAPSSFYTPFLPKYLSREGYTVCVYDRRGYGWSETYEHDRMGALWDEIHHKQNVLENVKFLRQLISKVYFNVPFFYIGHGGFGGMHVMEFLKQYAYLVAGAIFIDSPEVVSVFSHYSRERQGIMENFLAMGIRRTARWLGMLQLEDEFDGIIDTKNVTSIEIDEMYVSLENGHMISSNRRELDTIESMSCADYARAAFKDFDEPLRIPVLLIEPELIQANRTEDWFPWELDLLSHHIVVPDANHFTLMFSHKFTQYTSDIIDAFIKRR